MSERIAGAKISRVEQQILPAVPVPAAGLRLTGEIKDAVNGALDNQTPMMIAYSDDGGEIHVSFRGAVQAYSDDQLALWARDPEGGLPRHVTARPKVTLFYHDPKTRTTYTFYGRAWIADDPDIKTAVFDNSHPRERQMDFRRRGVAIVVDLDKLEGRGPAGRILMLRSLGMWRTLAGVLSGHEARCRDRPIWRCGRGGPRTSAPAPVCGSGVVLPRIVRQPAIELGVPGADHVGQLRFDGVELALHAAELGI